MIKGEIAMNVNDLRENAMNVNVGNEKGTSESVLKMIGTSVK
jgi:hypothetical protein